MASPHGDGIVRCPRDAYGDTFTADLLEQYKLYCTGPTVAASKMHHNDTEMSALGQLPTSYLHTNTPPATQTDGFFPLSVPCCRK